MADDIRAIVADLLAAWNSHDVEHVASFYAPDYEGIDVGQARVQQGRADIARSVAHFLAAFPDVRFDGEIIVQGERAALIWHMRGTQRGAIMGIPPTGRTVAIHGSSILTVRDGLIVHGIYVWDMAGMLRHLGLLPDLR